MMLSKLRVIAVTTPSFRKMAKFGKTAFSPKYLLHTNILVSGTLSAFGDVIQQKYQQSKPDKMERWNPNRTGHMLAAGLCLGPISHFWYLFLDRLIPGATVRTVMIKLVPDLLLFSPGYILLFLLVTGILEGQSWTDFKKEIRDKSGALFKVELFLWTPAQFANFYFLPTRFRVLYDNIVSLFADVLYSYFRYDFEVESKDCEPDSGNQHEKSVFKDVSPCFGLLAAGNESGRSQRT